MIMMQLFAYVHYVPNGDGLQKHLRQLPTHFQPFPINQPLPRSGDSACGPYLPVAYPPPYHPDHPLRPLLEVACDGLIQIKEGVAQQGDKGVMIQHPALLAAPVLLALAACVTTPAPTPPPPAPAFVQAACGGCHATEPPFLSPNPGVPSFEAIANRPGVTKATIRAWLVNAHNYPEDMDFTLERDHVETIAEYMITLRRAGYVPVE